MARTGFRLAKYNLISGDKYAAVTEGVPVLNKVVDEKFAPEYNNAELYANDSLCESDYSFKKGTLSLTIADDEDTLLATLFGDTKGETENANEYTKNIEATAPYVGYGHIIPKMVEGVRCYKVEFFPKVKFTKLTADNKTAGDTTEFATTSLEATVYPVDTLTGFNFGDWEKHQTFTTMSAAETYLDGLLTPTV